MNTNNPIPNEKIIGSVLHSMTGDEALVITRMSTGDQNFVYAIKTANADYVLRMTNSMHKHKFLAAIDWQKILLPLGIPLAQFISSDLENKYSPFPALLMRRLPGDDLINVYSELTIDVKKSLAIEMIAIQNRCKQLLEGPGYGILDNYGDISSDKSWFEFLAKRLEHYHAHITKSGFFNPQFAKAAISIANDMEEHFSVIRPTPFLWDASERNVLIHQGKIAGIVDVDEICFGDPLLVIALTSTCLELEGLDTVYSDYWAEYLHLDHSAQARLNFYRLFYSVAFMRKHSMQTANNKKVMFDTERLLDIFQKSLERLIKVS